MGLIINNKENSCEGIWCDCRGLTLSRRCMRVMVILFCIAFSAIADAETVFQKSAKGDSFAYIPEDKASNILVVAHGMLSSNETAEDAARRYLNRWMQYADKHNVIVIVPVFDTRRFGNLGGGYGGYRNLFGRHLAADKFVNDLVDQYSNRTSTGSSQFYLYGHSAGGQFVNRYTVTHPERVIRAVVSAAGRYSYPTTSVQWPYGAGSLQKRIRWKDGTETQISIAKSLLNYANAANRIDIVIGGEDLKRQPARPAHIGETRVDFARSWAAAMNRNAERFGVGGNVEVHVIPGIGHDSAKLTPYSANLLFGQ